MEIPNKLDKKKEAFDKEFRVFVTQATETIKAKYGKMIEMGIANNDLTCLANYLHIYNTMNDPAEHFQYFEMVYNANRVNILNCINDMNWLLKGDICIQFGSNKKLSKDAEEKRKAYRINLSSIFITADELREEADELYKKMDEKFISDDDAKDMIRFDILLLHLMRIFYHLNDSNDKQTLLKIVNDLEEKLGTTVRTKEEVVVQPQATAGNSQGGIGQLYGLTNRIMGHLGFQLPAHMQLPDEDKIFGAVEAIMTNEQTKSAITGMMTSLNGCTDVGQAIRTVVGGMTDPNTMSALQGTLQNTMQEANPNNTPNVASNTTANTTTDVIPNTTTDVTPNTTTDQK